MGLKTMTCHGFAWFQKVLSIVKYFQNPPIGHARLDNISSIVKKILHAGMPITPCHIKINKILNPKSV